MHHRFGIISLALISALVSCSRTPGMQEIEARFSGQPPREAYPWVWWHWMDGNISQDGIRKDLQWMKEVGVAGFHQFDVGGRNTPQIIPEKVEYLSPEWKEDMRLALHLADSLGLEAGFAGCPGWSCTGGPWVSAEQAMKKLVWSAVETSDGSFTLPQPVTTVGKYQDVPYADAADVEPWYRDIAVVAVKLPEEEVNIRDLAPKVTASDGDFTLDILTDGRLSTLGTVNPSAREGGSWIRYDFQTPQTFCAVTVADEMMRSRYIRYPAQAFLILEASMDGKEYVEAARIPGSVIYAQTVDFPPVTGCCWRLKILPGDAQYANRHDIREFVLHSVPKVNRAQEKAGFAAQDDFMRYPTPVSAHPVQEVRVLQPGESLPEGRWRVYRFGQALTGKKNHPTSPDATGLEVDKLDPDAWLHHFRSYLGIYREAAGKDWGHPYLLNDSYEAEQMTWTARMQEEFQARKGYDLLPWLPALSGDIVGSSEETERFLWDWRDVIGQLFCENYDRLSLIIKEFGLKGRYTESHEDGRLFVGDGMDPKIGADVPMSAIWMHNAPSNHNIVTIGQADIRESASVSHIWGQKYVAAESFTVSGARRRGYTYCPENLKHTADLALGSGLNRFVIHESAHQPTDEALPGAGLFQYGQWFNRHETWATMARPWMDYLARSCYILQQGRSVADILLYYGEDNCVVGLYGRSAPEIPRGYNFDYINPTGVKTALKVRGGRLVAPSGARYEVLVLGDNCRRMSLPVLRKLVSLAQDCAVLCGTLPTEPAGRCDATPEFEALCARLSSLLQPGTVEEVLKERGIAPDFACAAEDLQFVHRQAAGAHFYWVRNFGKMAVETAVSLRVPGARSLEIWNPETGRREAAAGFEVTKDGISAPLRLGRNEALFLVARRDGGSALPAPVLSGESLPLEGPWKVDFAAPYGDSLRVVWNHLEDWTLSSDPLVRYYSGVAEYRTTFSLEGVPSVAVLNLGKVKNLASVTLNGIPVGTAWKAPFTLEIPSAALRSGENELCVQVANLWVNRLVGDACENRQRLSTPVVFYRAADPLLPSGLLGPVSLNL